MPHICAFPAAHHPLERCDGAVSDIAMRDTLARRVGIKDCLPNAWPGSKRHDNGGTITHVTVVWQKGWREEWLKFGKPVSSRIIDRCQRIESYSAGETFALVSWSANSYAKAHCALYIVRAAGAGEPVIPVPQVDPGGDLLLCVHGWQKVAQVSQLIDAITGSAIDPCDVAHDYWRHIHNRVAAQQKPSRYSRAHHLAWLERRTIGL